jgi:CubicO group peptidase (beta-lactamase class C family)
MIIARLLPHHLVAAATALTIGVSTRVPGQAPPVRELVRRADAYMQAAVQHDKFSGSVLIARRGVPVFSRGYGMANIEFGAPSTPASVFVIGSLAKGFTSMAVMQLRDRGKLRLTDPICQYLDRCPASWAPVTIRHLLTHTSGIVNFSSLPDWDDSLSYRQYSRDGFVDVFRAQPLLFEPGTQFKYSNSGYYLLALIVERTSGMRFEAYLREQVFVPAGMASSRAEDARTLVPNRAAGYYWSGNTFVHGSYENPLLGLGAGSMLSTTEDLLRWDAALNGDRLLSAASRDEMFTPALNNYAYGWERGPVLDRPAISHSGAERGFHTFLLRLPSDSVTVIVLSNSDRTSARRVAISLAAIQFGKPYTMPRARLFDVLGATIAARGAEAAVRQYHELRRTRPTDFEFNEDVLNELGYDLLGTEKVQDAIAVFTLMTEMHPQSSNAFDSLGEAWMVRGDTAAAIRHYERSLALDGNNTNAVRQLAKLRGVPRE